MIPIMQRPHYGMEFTTKDLTCRFNKQTFLDRNLYEASGFMDLQNNG